MGQEQSLVKIEETTSVVAPGRRCLVTGPLDDLCNYDQLFEALTCAFRTDITKDPNLKSAEIMELSDNCFRVLRIFDGEKLKAPRDINVKSVFSVDKELGEVREEQRHVLLDGLEEARVIKVLKDPLRLEFLAQRIIRDNRGGPIPCGTLVGILRKTCKRDDINGNVFRPSRMNQQRVDPKFMVAESQPLDDIISYDDLVSGLIDEFKTMEFIDFALSGTAQVRGERKVSTPLYTKEFFETHFKVRGSKLVELGMVKADPEEVGDVDWMSYVEHCSLKDPSVTDPDQDARKGHVFTYTLAWPTSKQMIDVQFLAVFREPQLVVECWANTVTSFDDQSPDPVHHIFRFYQIQTFQSWVNALVERLQQ